MRQLGIAWVVLAAVLLTGCNQLERLTLARPNAQPRGYTLIAPPYDVSGKQAKNGEEPVMLLAVATARYSRCILYTSRCV